MTPWHSAQSAARRNLCRSLATASLLLVACSIAAQTPAPPTLDQLLAAKQTALATNDPDEIFRTSRDLAAATLRQLAALDLENPTKDHESTKALQALEHSDQLVSSLPTELLLLKAELAAPARDTPGLTALSERIVATNGDTAPIHLLLADTYRQAADTDDELRETLRAAALDPHSRDAQLALGMAWSELNEYQYSDQALQAFTAAQQLDPAGYMTNLQLGSMESQFHQFDPAAAHLRAAATADPAQPEPWLKLGFNLYDSGHLDDARTALEHFLSLLEQSRSGNPAQVRRALLVLDSIAIEQGRAPDPAHAQAEAELKHTLVLQTASFTGNQGQGIAAGMGVVDTTAAATHQPEPAPTAPAMPPQQLRELAANSLNDMGTVLARKHDYAAAVVPFRFAADEDPDLEPVLRNLGLAAYVSHEYAEGEKALRTVVERHPDDGAARGYLGLCLFELDDYADASSTFDTLGPNLESNPLFVATAAAAFARSGERPRAEAELEDLSKATVSAEVEAREAAAWLDLGDAGRAGTLAQAAVTATSDPADARLILGELKLEHGDDAAAAEEFRAEIKDLGDQTSPETEEARALLAEALLKGGRRAAAQTMIEEVRHADPDLAEALRHEGESLLHENDAYTALEKLEAAEALTPDAPDLRTDLAEAHHLLQAAPK